MSQHAALSSLFGEDPFFSQETLLWPLRREGLAALQHGFFGKRSQLVDSLLSELHDGPQQLLQLPQFPLASSALSRSTPDGTEEEQREGPRSDVQKASESNGDLLVTLDARGYAPQDITVKLEGRSLAVAAMKRAGAQESQSCSSASASASFCSSASSQMGFARRIELPAHLDLSLLSCSLMDDGQLRIHAPVAKQPIAEEREVPVRYRTSLEFPISKDEAGEEERADE